MKKRFLAVLLALVMCLGLAAPALAEDGYPDFIIDENGVLTKYMGPKGDVVVPEGVTAIGGGAFRHFPGLTSVTIPKGVTEIQGYAFNGCHDLTSVVIPEGVTKIGDGAFIDCSGLTGIDFPSSLTEIGVNAFRDCTGLTRANIPDGVVTIDDLAFAGCTALTDVTIPNSVNKIGSNAFEGTPWLERQGEFVVFNGILLAYQGKGGNVVIPKGVTEINETVFRFREDLTSATIPDGVTTIGWGAFDNCPNLTSVNLPDSVTSIGESAFSDCTSLTSITIPDSVTEIGDSVFFGCTGLTSVTIPNSITEIKYRMFIGCTSLTSVEIPDTVTKIGGSAFTYCSSLTSITIPDSVTEIGNNAFADCTSLSNIAIPGSISKIGDGAFSQTPWLERQGDFPAFNGTLLQYLGKDSAVVIPDGITAIGGSAFRFSDITNVTIPDSVTSIGDDAFYNCSYLNNVIIPDSVTEIGESAFTLCYNLTTVTVPASVTRIGEHAFAHIEGSESWTEYYIPDGLTIYGEAGSYAETYAKENKIPFVAGKPLAFADLRPNAFYLDAVDWAVSRGITTGKTPTTFGPKDTCTHGQILTFLWRAAGSPVSEAEPPFTLTGTEDYYGAAKWAYEKGMIGADFNHKAPCTRADAVNYIWQAFGKPAAEYGGQFTDVPATSSYAQAVAWALAADVTTGATATTFNPSGVCNRGEIVTFLYRAYK